MGALRASRFALRKLGCSWESFHVVPIEAGRGCPYGCDFCTVTGFFGDSIRFRNNDSVVDEMLRLKKRARDESGIVGVLFVDDNFAINVKRTKSLLRSIIDRDAVLPWTAQISINLLRDPELVELIAASGGRWIFCGLESIDPRNLDGVNKSFNKPAQYRAILEGLADRGIYTITSFIFGMDSDRPGVAEKTLAAIRSWPPGLSVFGLLTPYPATPLYDRLYRQERLTRPKHWLDFQPFRMAFTPENITIEQAEAEVHDAWTRCYSPHGIAAALAVIEGRPFGERAVLLASKLAFRGIYIPQTSLRQWSKLLLDNRRSLTMMIQRGHRRPPEATAERARTAPHRA